MVSLAMFSILALISKLNLNCCMLPLRLSLVKLSLSTDSRLRASKAPDFRDDNLSSKYFLKSSNWSCKLSVFVRFELFPGVFCFVVALLRPLLLEFRWISSDKLDDEELSLELCEFARSPDITNWKKLWTKITVIKLSKFDTYTARQTNFWLQVSKKSLNSVFIPSIGWVRRIRLGNHCSKSNDKQTNSSQSPDTKNIETLDNQKSL